MKCLHCNTKISKVIDLGFMPPANDYINDINDLSYEKHYPLKVFFCKKCFLLQTNNILKSEDLFKKDYAYFSSFSSTWLDHAKRFCDDITKNLDLSKKNFIIEIASNDGYLLKNFVKKKIPCLGIEPALNASKIARRLGIKVINNFFSYKLSKELLKKYNKPDLIIANNVLAHVPDVNDLLKGIVNILSKEGVITIEFQHLYNIIKKIQFDTIYHEHFSYFSLIAVSNIFKRIGLKIWHVEEIPTHGGSLRLYASHGNSKYKINKSFNKIISKEIKLGLNKLETYKNFNKKILKIKTDTLKFLIDQKNHRKIVIGYGAAAKGNTLLNYFGIKEDLLNFVVDKSFVKLGKFIPGSHIKIESPSIIKKLKPNYIIILPWNLSSEIARELNYTKKWNCKLIILIPKLKII